MRGLISKRKNFAQRNFILIDAKMVSADLKATIGCVYDCHMSHPRSENKIAAAFSLDRRAQGCLQPMSNFAQTGH